MKLLFCFTFLLLGTISFSQTIKDTTKINQLEEVILSSVRVPKKKEVLPIQVESINLKQIEFQNFAFFVVMLIVPPKASLPKSVEVGP